MLLADVHDVSQPTISRVYYRMLLLVPGAWCLVRQALSFAGISLADAMDQKQHSSTKHQL
ncbi:hypothetical protein [Devriesea agamarum]|uniref:hypothetical protein n=1 Tax=Devriesea agamarum TaxID=472569 RepID=UPI00071DD20F|nr:hypothetical protein [Devriesea agamarum]